MFSEKKVVEENKTRILCPVTPPPENLSVYDKVEKFCGAEHAHCTLDT